MKKVKLTEVFKIKEIDWSKFPTSKDPKHPLGSEKDKQNKIDSDLKSIQQLDAEYKFPIAFEESPMDGNFNEWEWFENKNGNELHAKKKTGKTHYVWYNDQNEEYWGTIEE